MNKRDQITDPFVVRAYQRARAAIDATRAHCKTKSEDSDAWCKEFDRLDKLEGYAFAELMGVMSDVVDLPQTARGNNPEGSSPRTEQSAGLGRRSTAPKS